MGVGLRERERGHGRSGDSGFPADKSPNLEPLTPGLRTRILNPAVGRWDRAGTVLETTAPRQYLVGPWTAVGAPTIGKPGRHRAALFHVRSGARRRDNSDAWSHPPTQPRKALNATDRPPRHLLDYVLGNATLQATH
ncbi:hypothetical protein GWK47_042695 [Chionoecetes opilio]|uniref:Uncharacterized protein n=1 Tax=Chionoecetes opilio TaxID=41210 RepID=A0A8J4YMP7_CHIOP|nr:hypothetical protein GWK47_042695 [Chionoecetes opilio]